MNSDRTIPPVTRLRVHGMNCGACARKVTVAAQAVPTVQSVDVDLDAQLACVHWNTTDTDIHAVSTSIQSAGYRVEVLAAASEEEGGKRSGWLDGLWVGIFGTVAMMAGEWVAGVGQEPWFRWLSLVLGCLVQVVAGGRFYRGAWLQLRSGKSNMDTLVSLGSSAAFGYSVWALLTGWPGHLYFMEAAAIITVVSVGHWLESRVSARAAGALKSLLSLAPRKARRLSADGTEEDVPLATLEVGDRVRLRPGDSVPTDGLVEEGESAVDESMLTGESLPLQKRAGSELYAGTANLDGRLVMRVTATGDATALAHIIAAVRRAQNSSASIQRLGDRVSSVFVPIVLGVALVSALGWILAYDRMVALHQQLAAFLWTVPVPETGIAAGCIVGVAVLIIACPCAMGLATPTAIMAAANVAARRGVLIRDGVALERAGAVTSVIFDKTGTLTVGRPMVAGVHVVPTDSLPGLTEDVRRVAAAMARPSQHPFSRAIAGLTEEPMTFLEWRELRGAGLVAKLDRDGQESVLRLGSLRWVCRKATAAGAEAAFIDQWSGRGASLTGLTVNEELAAIFALQDELKPGAAEVVQALEQSGARVYMATGDNKRTALSLASQVGLPEDRVLAEVRPEQKAEFVSQLQQRGERVAFVGDGINDAPALEQAHLGVAVGGASEIARDAADMVLLNSDIHAVPDSLELARATLRTIRQNLFWAFFYNAAAIPLAAVGFLSPIICALAMGGSDLVVIGNALRLKTRFPQRRPG